MRNWQNDFAGAAPFASFFGRRRFFESGEVRLAILSLLAEGPKHGYQLMKELEERSGGLYRASAGSVYPTLQQLEDEGLIAAGQQEGKRVFSLTETGRAELEKDPEAVGRIWQRAEKWEEWGQCLNPETLHVLKPLGALTKAAWKAAARASGKHEAEKRLAQILERARKDLEGI
jgi:DNA-binding PadR family transcriptional regulator